MEHIKNGTKVVVVTDDQNRTASLVFFGVLLEFNRVRRSCVLANPQKADSFNDATEGVGGSASIGPQSNPGTQVSEASAIAEIFNVAYMLVATPAAITAWESHPWQ